MTKEASEGRRAGKEGKKAWLVSVFSFQNKVEQRNRTHTRRPEPETETETKVVDETKTEKKESKVDTPPLAVTDETKDDNSSGDTLTTTTVVKE